MKNCKPVVLDGKILPNYFVCPEGNIWSNKRAGFKKLSTSLRGGNRGDSSYPAVNVMVGKNKRTINVHRLVCQTYHAYPRPAAMTEQSWRTTPNIAKQLIYVGYQVNHIDHDHSNHHPSNLEWVTGAENVQSYQNYRAKNSS